MTRLPLEERKRRLLTVVPDSGILISASLPGTAVRVIAVVRRAGLEGVIAKRRDSSYVPGVRSDAWVKLKLDRQQEFVIGGYRPGPHGLDALVVGEGVLVTQDLHYPHRCVSVPLFGHVGENRLQILHRAFQFGDGRSQRVRSAFQHLHAPGNGGGGLAFLLQRECVRPLLAELHDSIVRIAQRAKLRFNFSPQVFVVRVEQIDLRRDMFR